VKVEGFSGVGWPKNGQGENQMDAKVLRVPEVGGELALAGGISVVVMPEAEAEEVWRGDDPSVLVETSADVYSDGKRWVLQSKDPEFKFIVHGATKVSAEGQRVERDQEKNAYRVMVPKVELQAKVTKLADAKPRQPWVMSAPLSWRPQALPIKPAVEEFAGAAVWKIEVSAVPKGAALSDVMLEIGYQGDEARLSDQAGLVDDNFWNGLPWSVGLKEVSAGWRAGEAFELRVLPLPKAYPMYLEGGGVLRFGKDGMAGVLDGVKAVPVYEVELGIRD
jgi:beta-galactosidase